MKNLLLFLLISTTSFAQNKKEQIEILNFRVDSLNTVLSATRDNSTKDISVLNDNIKEISNEVTALKSDLTNLQTSNNKLKTDLEELSMKNLELEAKLEAVELKKTSFKTVKIGNLEVMSEDLGEMSWEFAKMACKNLGDGWRLPTKDELNVLYENKEKIGGFAYNAYWSSTEFENRDAWYKDVTSGRQDYFNKNFNFGVRAVRAF